MKRVIFLVSLHLLLSPIAFSQNKFSVNQKVEAEYKGKWYKATILKVTGNNYTIHYDGYSSSSDETVGAARLRAIETADAKAKKALFKYGKYACSATKFSGGSYEFIPRGSFVLSKNGTYAYNGFAKPSTGTFTVNGAGVISFKGGYFDGGEATPMEDRENRYYVVFPTIPDNRWTCSFVE